MNIYDDLKWRGLVYQVSDEAKVREYFETPGRRLYCGFDPTAPSLHIGNMVPLIALLRCKRAGHAPLFLMGGATSMIGDPSGKDVERQLQSRERLAASAANIKAQVERLFEGECDFVNNYDWTSQMSCIDFLREVGKHFTVNWMMQKESVKNRITRDDVGISFTEFSYMLLQANDFAYLAENHDCMLQIGGSDQWGNITAGAELIRKKLSREGYALTFPLITTASGQKFGKSQKGAVYMDPNMTSVYDFYQYWVRTDDRDVIRFIKYFTFLSREEIGVMENALAEHPEQRLPHRRLAAEMTTLVHGADELSKVEAASAALFGAGDIRTADLATLRSILAEAASHAYPSLAELPDLPQVLVDLGLAASKGQARKDIQAGGVYLNNERVQDAAFTPSADDLLHGEVLLLRKGKRNYGVVSFG